MTWQKYHLPTKKIISKRIITMTLEKYEPKQTGYFYLSFMMVTVARWPKIKDTKLQ
jgi:hypothetical protein